MPFTVPFKNEVTYNKHEIDNKFEGAISAAIGMNGSKSKTDTLEWRYRGTLPSPGYLLRDPVYDAPWWYPVPFESMIDAVVARVLARSADKATLAQRTLFFQLASAAQNTWSPADALITKLGFYATGEMKLEIGTEDQFTGGTHDEWKSTAALLDTTLQTEFSNGTLFVLAVGRTVFRFAI